MNATDEERMTGGRGGMCSCGLPYRLFTLDFATGEARFYWCPACDGMPSKDAEKYRERWGVGRAKD